MSLDLWYEHHTRPTTIPGYRYNPLAANYHRARRPHQCAECGISIQPGEHYIRAWQPGIGEDDEGAIVDYCPDCATDAGYLFAPEA